MREETTQEAKEFLSSFPGLAQLATEDGRMFKIESARYLVRPSVKLSSISVPHSQTFVTIIPVKPGLALTGIWFDRILRHVQSDDVHHPLFLQAIIFAGASEQEISFSPEILDRMRELEILWHTFLAQHSNDLELAAGPHLFSFGMLSQIFRVYDDANGAFLLGVQPSVGHAPGPINSSYRELTIKGEGYGKLGLATPSRTLSLQASTQKPLMGVRIAVKDLFRVRGLKTSLCNQAYLDVNEPATKTAAVVDALCQAGAQVLGMTKLSSLISREEPSEAVDFQTAFNPRGDNYQSPAGSSSGSAVAVAAYEWVDLAIGTDTSGSGRRPALVNGVFQFRPSHDMICHDGMIPTFLPWDTACLFSRDIRKIQDILAIWHSTTNISRGISVGHTALPAAIYFPEDYFPVQNQDQMSMVESFVLDLEKFLNIRKTKISISALWNKKPPFQLKPNSQSVQEFLGKVAVETYYHDFYHSTDSFRAKYHERYHKEPYVTPFNHWRWNLGKQVTSSQHHEGMSRLTIYKEWFLNEVMRSTEVQSLLILPVQNVQPHYRDEPPPKPMIQEGFDQLFVPPILGAPDILVPLGEVPYFSKVTGREEYLPVGVDIVGLPHSDLSLLNTIRDCLTSSSRPLGVSTGARLFESEGKRVEIFGSLTYQ